MLKQHGPPSIAQGGLQAAKIDRSLHVLDTKAEAGDGFAEFITGGAAHRQGPTDAHHRADREGALGNVHIAALQPITEHHPARGRGQAGGHRDIDGPAQGVYPQGTRGR